MFSVKRKVLSTDLVNNTRIWMDWLFYIQRKDYNIQVQFYCHNVYFL